MKNIKFYNIYMFISSFTRNIIDLYSVVLLYQNGISLNNIIGIYAITYFIGIFISTISLKLGNKIGYKYILIASSIITSISFYIINNYTNPYLIALFLSLSMYTYHPIKHYYGINLLNKKKEIGNTIILTYIATILSVYRKLIDMYSNNIYDEAYINRAKKILFRCANRSVAAQFFDKAPTFNEQYYIGRQEDSNQDFLGIVLGYDEETKEAIIEQRNHFKINDKATIFGPNMEDYSFVITKITDEDGLLLDAARHPRQIVRINCDKKIDKNSLMRVNFLD